MSCTCMSRTHPCRRVQTNPQWWRQWMPEITSCQPTFSWNLTTASLIQMHTCEISKPGWDVRRCCLWGVARLVLCTASATEEEPPRLLVLQRWLKSRLLKIVTKIKKNDKDSHHHTRRAAPLWERQPLVACWRKRNVAKECRPPKQTRKWIWLIIF